MATAQPLHPLRQRQRPRKERSNASSRSRFTPRRIRKGQREQYLQNPGMPERLMVDFVIAEDQKKHVSLYLSDVDLGLHTEALVDLVRSDTGGASCSSTLRPPSRMNWMR